MAKLSKIAADASDVADFDGVLAGLGALGPEIGVLGGILMIGGDLMGGPTP
jgi:hypothetical protein